MKFYSTNLLAKVRAHIKNGGLIAYPTESCYGIGCDPFNRIAIDRVIQIKGRKRSKGLIVIAGSQKQLKDLLSKEALSDSINDKFDDYWPGPYSLILPVSNKVPNNLTGKHAKIAVRVTRHKLVQQLSQHLNLPLVSTSANRSGFKSIRTYRECKRQFGKKLMVLPGITNFSKKPSTIIDWETKKVLR